MAEQVKISMFDTMMEDAPKFAMWEMFWSNPIAFVFTALYCLGGVGMITDRGVSTGDFMDDSWINSGLDVFLWFLIVAWDLFYLFLPVIVIMLFFIVFVPCIIEHLIFWLICVPGYFAAGVEFRDHTSEALWLPLWIFETFHADNILWLLFNIIGHTGDIVVKMAHDPLGIWVLSGICILLLIGIFKMFQKADVEEYEDDDDDDDEPPKDYEEDFGKILT